MRSYKISEFIKGIEVLTDISSARKLPLHAIFARDVVQVELMEVGGRGSTDQTPAAPSLVRMSAL